MQQEANFPVQGNALNYSLIVISKLIVETDFLTPYVWVQAKNNIGKFQLNIHGPNRT